MTIANSNLLDLLGKQVSFSVQTTFDKKILIRHKTGIITDIIFNLHGVNEFSLNGDFYQFNSITHLEILDS